METLTPDQIDKRHLCIRAIGLIARQIACAAEGDLELAATYQIEFQRTLDILRGNAGEG